MLVPILAVTSMYATMRERMLQTNKAFVQVSTPGKSLPLDATSYQAIMRSKLSISSVVARITKGI